MIDEYLQSQGVVVSSLQFDGLHVEHIVGDEYEHGLGWRRLEEAIRRAEDAVQRKLGYKIGLMEKPLFSGGLTEDEEEGRSDADNQSTSEGDGDDS